MARKITHLLTVEGNLIALTPLHVGAAEEGPITDMAVARDGLGRCYIPGSSLGGAIRAFSGAGETDVRWGFAQGEDEGSASHIIIDDAPATETTEVELWHGNGIDRRWGTAADRIKYDREVLPRGTRLAFRLTCEVTAEQNVSEQRGYLAWLVQALERGELPLGAAATRGLGRVKLLNARCGEQDWGTPEGVLSWLQGNAERDRRAAWIEDLPQHRAAPRQRIRFEIHWRPDGPLMSRSARDGVVVDGLPFVSRRDDGRLAPVLPGAGIKGAWRSQAERIVRTVLGQGDVPNVHHEQVDVLLVRRLFGRARPADKVRGRNPDPGGSKGRLGFRSCYAHFALPARSWDALEGNESDWRPPPSAERPMAMAMHVAVDRWTGGAAESRLYSAVEPMGLEWEPLRLELNRPQDSLAQVALLWLVLRDFCDGRVPLGYGVNRGYGDLSVERVVIEGLNALDLESDRAELTVKGGHLEERPVENLVERLRVAWSQWLASPKEEGVQ